MMEMGCMTHRVFKPRFHRLSKAVQPGPKAARLAKRQKLFFVIIIMVNDCHHHNDDGIENGLVAMSLHHQHCLITILITIA